MITSATSSCHLKSLCRGLLGFLACWLAVSGLVTRWVAADDGVLPPSYSVRPELYATGFAFAEGPALDNDGNLYVVNYRYKGTIGRIAADGTASIWCDLNEAAPIEGRHVQGNGCKIDSEGRLIVADAGGGRVLRISDDGAKVEVLADRCQGTRFTSINDVALDCEGSIYFTDPGGSNVETPIGAVYRYNIQTHQTSCLVQGLAFPNGIAVTPDQTHVCVAESHRHRVLVFPLDLPEDGVREGRVLIEFPEQTLGEIRGGDFIPDGMIFDEHGFLYVAMWTGGIINVVDVSSGMLVRQYDAGGSRVTNCHFCGGFLYTTVAAKEAVFRLKLNVRGFPYATGSATESSGAPTLD